MCSARMGTILVLRSSKQEIPKKKAVEWVQARAQQAEQVLGICTGAFILASAGLLDGLEVTTHHERLDHLEEIAPKATVCEQRVVDGGKILTSGGIAPGIDLSLSLRWRKDSSGRPRIPARTCCRSTRPSSWGAARTCVSTSMC